jgi:hypothetical protein
MRGGTLTKKELVEIGGRPIIWHVMRIFSAHGFNRFVLPLGYEAGQLRRYFLDYEAMTRDFTIRVGSPALQEDESNPLPNPLPRGEETSKITFRGLEQHPEWEVSLVRHRPEDRQGWAHRSCGGVPDGRPLLRYLR